MDEMLKLWALDMHGGDGGGSGSSMLGQLMDCQGELIRGSRSGSRMLLSWSADIEVIVNKHLAVPLAMVVHEHYLNRQSLEHQKWERCGCRRSQFYERLHAAHLEIAGMLLERAA
ncbi:PA0613 family protein [Pseudomonas sp. S9]|uniref:PA0613 family protein n=1 Tax=Pseudomonas sp. S9 TaxID=686578 RepID=UPI0002556FEA